VFYLLSLFDVGGVELLLELAEETQVDVLYLVVFKHDEWLQNILEDIDKLTVQLKLALDLTEHPFRGRHAS